MADTERHERTENATPKRREEARRQGNIPRSRDLSAAAVMIAAGAALYFMGGAVGSRLSGIMRSSLALTPQQTLDPGYLASALRGASSEALLAIAPVFGCTLLAAVAAPLALGGWAFSPAAMTFKFDRLSPIAGLRRMFAPANLVELGKALAKFGAVATAGTLVLWHEADALVGLGREPVASAIGHATQIAGQALLALSGALIVIAGIDVPFQLWRYNRELRMTREEVRQEAREQDGSPEIKGRIRTLQRERAQRRMMLDVPKADVVIVNPTHYAVALRYDEQRMRAPVVVAKGVDLIAGRIREVAAEHAVPILEAPPLARALYRSVEIGGEIPASLYVAVAQALTYIFQLRDARSRHLAPPPAPTIDIQEP